MKDRMIAIDVLRGMTICLMIIVNTPGSWAYVWAPLRHAEWHGCTLTDLVFPSFLFVIGLSMAFSLRKVSTLSQKELILKVAKRGALIFLIGLLLNWFPFYYKHISDLRIFGVLQRIGMAYVLAGILIVTLKGNQKLIISIVVLFLAHWAILYFLGGSSPYSLEQNISGKIDLFFFNEAQLYGGFGIKFDPEGILGNLSSAGQIIVGFLISKSLLQNGVQKAVSKTLRLSLAMIAFGLLWSLVYPLNKPLWTGSYATYTSGIVLLTLSLLIWLIDIKKLRKWTFPFQVFGYNPLFSFILSIAFVKIFLIVIKIDGRNLYSYLFKFVYEPIFGSYWGSFLYAVSFAGLIWMFSYWAFVKKRVFKI